MADCKHSHVTVVRDHAEHVWMFPRLSHRWWHRWRFLRPIVPHHYCAKCGDRLPHLDTRFYG